jgi:ComF family protein
MCSCCGRPFELAPQVEKAPELCRLCRANFYAFERARSFAYYNDALAGAIVLLKYEEVTRLGHWFAERLAEVIRNAGEEFQADAVVPVPLHPDRQRERGYNQAELIARPLSRLLHLPLATKALVRTKPRPGVLRLTRKQRWEAVRGAFEPLRSSQVDNRRVLLLDDVFTTGATLDACSRALRRAGASRVMALTVARAAADWSSQGV